MEGITFWVSSCVEEMITMSAQLNRSLRCVIFIYIFHLLRYPGGFSWFNSLDIRNFSRKSSRLTCSRRLRKCGFKVNLKLSFYSRFSGLKVISAQRTR